MADDSADSDDTAGTEGGTSSNNRTSTAGLLLVSVPDLGDDNFDRSVVLIIDHDHQGALGLVLNSPSDTAVSDHLPQLVDSLASPSVFFVGGPVSVGGLMALGRRSLNSNPQGAVGLVGPVVLVDPQALVNGDVHGVEALRLFTGYSGWGAGQLESELDQGVWYTVDALSDDVLCRDPDTLWRTVLKRQGGRLASQSLYPDDPSVN